MPDNDQNDTDLTEIEATEQDPGAKLKAAREAQGLSIDDVSAELRIELVTLRALEEGRLEDVGAPVFAKGYIKQYGNMVGLPVAELLEDYDRLGGKQSVQVEPSKTIRLRDERQVTVWIVAALVLAAVGGYLAYWWLGQTG